MSISELYIKSICEMSNDNADPNKYRKRGEIYVVEDNKIWVGVDSNGKFNIPGGQLHDDETPKEGAIRETLEEVAIRPKNIINISTTPPYRTEFPEENSMWKGMIIYSFKAEFDKWDKSKFGDGPEGELKPTLVDLSSIVAHNMKRKQLYKPLWKKQRAQYIIDIAKMLLT